MTFRQFIATAITMSLCGLRLMAQPQHSMTYYDEEDGVPSSHVTQLLQDGHGFLWMATWNGLCRYDGYEFHTFKPTAGGSPLIVSDRIRNISIRTDGQLICRINDDDYALFDPRTCRFTALTGDKAQAAAIEAKRYRESRTLVVDGCLTWRDHEGTLWRLLPSGQLSYGDADGTFTVCDQLPESRNQHFAIRDSQDNLWVIALKGIYKVSTGKRRTHTLPIDPPSETKCLFIDNQSRYWVCTMDGAVRLYDESSNRPLGFLGTDGLLHNGYTCFPAPVYGMYQTDDGILWLGTKPDGIYRLTPQPSGRYTVGHLTQLPDLNIYDITSDSRGRLWVATLGGGLCYTTDPHAVQPTFVVPAGYPCDRAQRVRRVHITRQGLLVATTTDGLMTARLDDDAEKMQFFLHQREPDKVGSLSSNATMDILEDAQGQIFVGTEDNGINTSNAIDLTTGHLTFRHIIPDDEPSHSVIQSLTTTGKGGWMAVNGRQLTLFDSIGNSRVIDARHLQSDYRFSEARPQSLSGDRWLFGTDSGAFVMDGELMRQPAYIPRMVLTSLSVQGGENRWNVEYADTLRLASHERSIIVRFAALDFVTSERISYAFRLSEGKGNEPWNDLGHNRSVTLLDLEPGTYTLQLRSTDSGGQWQDNIRQLCIIVAPTFWEAWYGRLTLLFLGLAIVSAALYTSYYIRSIRRQHREMQEKYLSLLDERDRQPAESHESAIDMPTTPTDSRLSEDDDAFMTRVMTYIEQHIGDSDANIDDMAATAAVSRSGLIRKLKSIVGQTPANFMREARIKRACQLLATTADSVADIAYHCGFTEPKYFSRSFRSSTGMSPSDYRQAHMPQ